MTIPSISLMPQPGDPYDPDLDALHDLTRDKAKEFGLVVARARDAFYWRMIAAGWLPSQGWRMGERIHHDARRMSVEHYAIPPRIKPIASA